jgi:hypothetical protein
VIGARARGNTTPVNITAERQLRVRVVAAIEDRVRQFRRREELWPLRIPVEPIPLDEVVAQALGTGVRFDPAALRVRPLMSLEWPDGSTWTAWVLGLPSGLKVYGDSSHDEIRLLASGGRNEGEASDRAFLELLAESAGGHFGIEMAGGPPSRVRSAIASRAFLLEFFVNLFELSGVEASLRQQLTTTASSHTPAQAEWDFRHDVAHWLDVALRPSRSSAGRG